jgi:tRNA-intron endonuclease
LKGELIESRIVVWNVADSQELFDRGYYGKPVGIPKPKPGEIDAPLILDLIEGMYLLENSEIAVYRSGTKVTPNDMLEVCRSEYHDFDKKYLVYRNFRDLGYVVNPGIKFGCDFAVYEKGPGIDHAPYLVQVYGRREQITSTGVVRAGRLATTVRKHFILAIPHSRGKVDYLALDWWKA